MNTLKKAGLNTGDILHIIQIAVLLISCGVGFAKLQTAETTVQNVADQLNRVEHYLSSHDAKYWQSVKQE